MKYALFFGLIFLVLSCKKDESPDYSIKDSSTQKDKYLIEAKRDVESLDSTILVNSDDFIRIRLDMFPSFEEAHSIDLDFNDKEVRFFQTTQNKSLYITNEYHKLPKNQKEEYLYNEMKLNESVNFDFRLNQKEIEELVNSLKYLKQSKYKTKMVEMFDGASFYMSINEKDTIVLMGTNSPSSHQRNFLNKLFEICQIHTNDSITRRNIERLKEYL